MNLLFLGTEEDRSYLYHLKSMVADATVFILLSPVSTVYEVTLYCQKRNITGVVSTNLHLLRKLSDDPKATLDDYAGSFFTKDSIDYVFIHPLDLFVKVSYQKFLTKRFISKLTKPEGWFPEVPFSWERLSVSNSDSLFSLYSSALLLAVDIETYKENLAIRCIGFTAIFTRDDGTFHSHSCVLPLDSIENLYIARKFCWDLKAPKVFQNGKYDIAYLSRYNIIPYNYLFDTVTAFHSWYCEFPKDLGFLAAFFIRKGRYWKNLADTFDLEQYYLYNCRDHWATALVMLAWISESPEWARTNYMKEFSVVPACHLSEMTGVRRDFTRMNDARTEIKAAIMKDLTRFHAILGRPVNPNSSQQVKVLLKVLGCGDIESTNEKDLKKAIYRHPLNAWILNLVLEIRGNRKLLSTYLRTDEDKEKKSDRGGKELNGRILYALNPHGTDSGRLASREHHFWCGLQIQNIPRGKSVKQTIIADDGFLFGECDLRQAESRDTAYCAGDESLITAVTGSRDFHAVNASAFFGLPYESIYDDGTGKTINKIIRDLSKRVNHGANYCMGAGVLLDTMGIENVELARKYLGLNKLWSPLKICEYLLERFHSTYPKLEGIYYPAIVSEVTTTHKLVGVTGWTRYCFGSPDKNKRDKNSYVAHVAQSLNAMVLNTAYLSCFKELAMNPAHSRNFKLNAQIHDSILFQFREGHEYLAEEVKRRMEISVTVRGADKKVRTFTVPADLKMGATGLGAKYWSDVE